MEENYLPQGYQLQEFRIESVLGEGGFGITYLATDTNLNTQVVIKEFLPREFSARNPQNRTVTPYSTVDENGTYDYLRQKFVNEAQILASIRHPNIVRVFSFFKANNTAYFVMDYIEGESLKTYLSKKEALEFQEILSIIMPILEGLKRVHEKEYLHRDIAPDNIYLRNNSMPMLIDFGAAKNATREHSLSLSAIVKSGYSAPEQYMTNARQSPATDIYSVGSLLYSMISGKVAPEAPKRQMEILNGNIDPLEEILSQYKDRYPKELLEIIQRAMSIKEKKRFQSVSEMQKSIANINLEHPTPTLKKNIIIILSIILAMLIIVGYFYREGETKEKIKNHTDENKSEKKVNYMLSDSERKMLEALNK